MSINDASNIVSNCSDLHIVLKCYFWALVLCNCSSCLEILGVNNFLQCNSSNVMNYKIFSFWDILSPHVKSQRIYESLCCWFGFETENVSSQVMLPSHVKVDAGKFLALFVSFLYQLDPIEQHFWYLKPLNFPTSLGRNCFQHAQLLTIALLNLELIELQSAYSFISLGCD